MIRLSKSRYCNGVQCPKMIWMKDNKMEVAETLYANSLPILPAHRAGRR